MILIVTNKADYTADFLILELNRLGIEFLRLNTEDFPQRVDLSLEFGTSGVAGHLTVSDVSVSVQEIRSIWYRRPLLCTPSEEIEDPAARDFIVTESKETLEGLWRILPCFWISHPDKLRAAESKIYQLAVASDLGFSIPDTLITNSPDTTVDFYEEKRPLIYKPVRRGRIVRDEVAGNIYTSLVHPEHVKHFEGVRLAPSLFQRYVPKSFDLRVTVVGDRVFAVEIRSQEVEGALLDWRRVEPEELRHVPHELDKDLQQKCILLVRSLGLAFGALDMIVTPEGEYIFLEINPSGQWAWIQQMCPEVRIREAIIDLLINGNDRHDPA